MSFFALIFLFSLLIVKNSILAMQDGLTVSAPICDSVKDSSVKKVTFRHDPKVNVRAAGAFLYKTLSAYKIKDGVSCGVACSRLPVGADYWCQRYIDLLQVESKSQDQDVACRGALHLGKMYWALSCLNIQGVEYDRTALVKDFGGVDQVSNSFVKGIEVAAHDMPFWIWKRGLPGSIEPVFENRITTLRQSFNVLLKHFGRESFVSQLKTEMQINGYYPSFDVLYSCSCLSPDSPCTLLCKAIEGKFFQAALDLIDHTPKERLTDTTCFGSSPLDYAIRMKCWPVVKRLVQVLDSSDLIEPDRNSQTPLCRILHYVGTPGYERGESHDLTSEICLDLIDKASASSLGIVDGQDKQTCLVFALMYYNNFRQKIACALVEKMLPEDLNQTDRYGQSVLYAFSLLLGSDWECFDLKPLAVRFVERLHVDQIRAIEGDQKEMRWLCQPGMEEVYAAFKGKRSRSLLSGLWLIARGRAGWLLQEREF